MKSKSFKLSGILVCFILFLAIFGLNPMVAKANEELYFDEDGNLYYITREKKATSSVKYYTIGWIIKRYDMPIDVKGQQYVIVTKSNYRPDEVDPNDGKYVYCYYKSDKDEILNAIKSVSMEWYDLLNKYGDTVYIDSVMTVLEQGVQQGFLYSGGSYTGEVYFDYEGIAGARDWASPQSLLVNFGMSVEFPVLYKPLASSISNIETETIRITNSFFSTATNGATDYDIAKGVPAGEELYVKAGVSSALYDLYVEKVTGKVTLCVGVPIKYILKWTDYYGVAREEVKEVKRYYTVDRYFSYYAYKGYTVKKLVGIKLNSKLFEEEYSEEYADELPPVIEEGSVIYSGVSGHMIGHSMSVNSAATVVVTSDNYLKPTIPEDDYSAYAETTVSQLKVRNDKLVINGNVIMSDEIERGETKLPEASFTTDTVVLEVEHMAIDKRVPNGAGYEINGVYYYEDNQGNISEYNVVGLKPVVVHTPVVCNDNIQVDKTLNQAKNPTPMDVVLGSYITLGFNDFGMHKNIPGYGVRSYEKYIDRRQVSFGFDVEYKGVRYGAGSVIDITGYYGSIYVCEDNPEGIYNVIARTLAYNSPISMSEDLFESDANISLGKYGANSYTQVRLIGRIEDFQVTYDGNDYFAKDMPVDALGVSEDVDEVKYVMEINTVGDISKEDYIKVEYKYYVKNEDNIIPVWIYEVEDRNIISEESLRLVENEEIWGYENCTLEGNKGVWLKEKSLSSEYIIVRPDTTEEDIRKAIAEKRLHELVIEVDSLYMAAEFLRYKDGEEYISYINEENARDGYCNMWLREEGEDEQPYGTYMKIGVAEDGYYDYEVSGTH